jgi:hypothetical protein
MDPELFRRMQEAAARFNAGESDFEEIITPAGPAHLVRDANDPRGFRLDFVGEGSKHGVPVQEYPAAQSRPPGYPAPLPFLPDCKAIVNTLDQSVTFVDPPDVDGSVERLVREMVDDGWTLQHPADGEALAPRFEKEGAERTLEVNADFGLPRLVVREQRQRSSET